MYLEASMLVSQHQKQLRKLGKPHVTHLSYTYSRNKKFFIIFLGLITKVVPLRNLELWAYITA